MAPVPHIEPCSSFAEALSVIELLKEEIRRLPCQVIIKDEPEDYHLFDRLPQAVLGEPRGRTLDLIYSPCCRMRFEGCMMVEYKETAQL